MPDRVVHQPQAFVRKAEVWEIAAVNKRQRTVDAWVSTETRDRMGDVIRAAGWELQSYRRNPVVLWAHSYYDPPIGRAGEIEVRGKRLWARTVFAESDLGDEVLQLYAERVMSAFSVGFRPLEWEAQYENEDDKGERFIGYEFKRQELLEYSAVPVPANAEALVAASVGGRFENVRRALSRMMPRDPESGRTPEADEGDSLHAVKHAAGLVAAQKSIGDLIARLTER